MRSRVEAAPVQGAAGQGVGPAKRLGDSEPGGGPEDDPDGARDIDEMSRGYEKGADPRPGPDDGPDGPPVEPEAAAAAAPGTGLPEFADEPRLGAADRGDVEQDADMRGDAQPPRVGDPLPVDEEEIGRAAERRDGGQDDGTLPECQKSGDIGKDEFPRGNGILDRFERRKSVQAGCGGNPIA